MNASAPVVATVLRLISDILRGVFTVVHPLVCMVAVALLVSAGLSMLGRASWAVACRSYWHLVPLAAIK